VEFQRTRRQRKSVYKCLGQPADQNFGLHAATTADLFDEGSAENDAARKDSRIATTS